MWQKDDNCLVTVPVAGRTMVDGDTVEDKSFLDDFFVTPLFFYSSFIMMHISFIIAFPLSSQYIS